MRPADGERVEMKNTDFLQLRGSAIRLVHVMHRPAVTPADDADGHGKQPADQRNGEAGVGTPAP